MDSKPFFHNDSGALRFWVTAEDGRPVGASITKEALHFRFRGQPGGEDALAIYAAHRDEIDAAVHRRLAAGSLEPVMLREFDVAARS
ncbi:MAG: DUF1488 family protein [Aquabacterium sp.]|jgi:hypothetical protein|nr:MAG: DUF1488 family protein [Aquabacterium sp.]TAL17688.1 MAG: DUF1488 family protein [Aquabacterium sp.]